MPKMLETQGARRSWAPVMSAVAADNGENSAFKIALQAAWVALTTGEAAHD
jgi:hypothetical protein